MKKDPGSLLPGFFARQIHVMPDDLEDPRDDEVWSPKRSAGFRILAIITLIFIAVCIVGGLIVALWPG